MTLSSLHAGLGCSGGLVCKRVLSVHLSVYIYPWRTVVMSMSSIASCPGVRDVRTVDDGGSWQAGTGTGWTWWQKQVGRNASSHAADRVHCEWQGRTATNTSWLLLQLLYCYWTHTWISDYIPGNYTRTWESILYTVRGFDAEACCQHALPTWPLKTVLPHQKENRSNALPSVDTTLERWSLSWQPVSITTLIKQPIRNTHSMSGTFCLDRSCLPARRGQQAAASKWHPVRPHMLIFRAWLDHTNTFISNRT